MENKAENFDKLYNEILPVLQKYECFRRAKFYKCIFIEIGIILAAAIIYYFVSPKLDADTSGFVFTLIFISAMACIAFLIANPVLSYKDFKSGLKCRCNKMLKKYFEDIKWGKSDVNDYLIKESQLFAEYNRIYYDDKFTGNYRDIPYSVAETNMLYITSGKRKMVFPVFKGVIISFYSNKKIKAHTLITSKGDSSIRNYNPANLFICALLLPVIFAYFREPELRPMSIICLISVLYILIDFFIKWRRFKGVKLEDLKFDKRFSVYSKDQIEARYLITPAFMDRMNNLRSVFGTKKIKCAFFDDQIVFAISTNKDLFELGDFHRSLLNKKKVKEFYDEIMAIYDIMDYFKLSEKTGL